MKLESVIQNEVIQKDKYRILMHIRIKKNPTDEVICREGMETQM